MHLQRAVALSLALIALLVALPASGSVAWRTESVDAALLVSAKEGSPTLIYFTADWCPACQDFQAQLLDTPAGGEATAGIRAVKVDVDEPG